MTKVRQIKITDYTTGRKKYKEITPEQHNSLLKTIATEQLSLDVELIKEREL